MPVATASALYALRLEVDGNMSVDATSIIDLSGDGYISFSDYSIPSHLSYVWPDNLAINQGTGKSACHGGQRFDTDSAGCGYGRYDKARFAGSGGHFYDANQNNAIASGGGIADIKAGGLALNGKILANGLNGFNLGGAGGAVNLDVGTLSGIGSIQANAGGPIGPDPTGNGYRGSGGGRISLYVDDDSAFTGSLSAKGSTDTDGNNAGGAGTVYIKRSTQIYGNLIVDNGGKAAQANSTRLRVVGIRAISALSQVNSTTWQVTVNTGTAWPVTNTAQDIGLQDLWVDLDRTTTDGPYYKVKSNTANQLVLEVPEGETIPTTFIGKELNGVHFFNSYSVINGASLYFGADRMVTSP